MNKRIANFINFILLQSLYCSCSVAVIFSVTLIKYNTFNLFLYSIIASTLLGIIFYSKKTLRIFGLSALGFFSLYAFLLYSSKSVYIFINRINRILNRAYIDLIGYTDYDNRMDGFFTTVAIILISIISLACFYKKRRIIPLVITSFICLLVMFLSEGTGDTLSFLISFVCILINYILKMYQDAAFNDSGFKRISSSTLTRFASVLCILSLIVGMVLPMPNPQAASLFGRIQNSFSSLSDFFDNFTSAVHYNSGFPRGDINLGGDMTLDYSKVMEVKSSEPVYLIGSVYDVYLGNKWTKSATEFLPSGGQLESLLSGAVATQKIQVEVTPYYTDDIIFYSPYPENITLPPQSVLMTNGMGEYRVAPLLNAQETYYVTSVKPVNIEENINNIANSASDNISEEYADYLSLPRSLPRHIKNLAHDLTKTHKSDYDKVKAIQHFLMQNCSYSLTPGDLPPGQDFTDHFINTAQRGYCTHFATALTVLCRAAGIPALYVSGYKTDMQNRVDGIYNVLKKDAHAWTLVYIDDVGWINFDATPPTDLNNQSNIVSNVPSGVSNVTSNAPRPSTSSSPSSNVQTSSESTVSSSSEDHIVDNNDNDQHGLGSYIMWVIIAIILAVLITIKIVSAILRQRKIVNAKDNNGILLIYKELIRIARLFGCEIKPYETPLQFYYRISKLPELEGFDTFKIIKLYYAIEFGRYSCTEQEVDAVRDIYNSLIENIKNKFNRLKFYFYRYLLNKI